MGILTSSSWLKQISYTTNKSFKWAHYTVWNLWKNSTVCQIKASCSSSKKSPLDCGPCLILSKTLNNIIPRITTATTKSSSHLCTIPRLWIIFESLLGSVCSVAVLFCWHRSSLKPVADFSLPLASSLPHSVPLCAAGSTSKGLICIERGGSNESQPCLASQCAGSAYWLLTDERRTAPLAKPHKCLVW